MPRNRFIQPHRASRYDYLEKIPAPFIDHALLQFNTLAELQAADFLYEGLNVRVMDVGYFQIQGAGSGGVALAGGVEAVTVVTADGVGNAKSYGAGTGDVVADTAAVQAMIDDGLHIAFLPDNDLEYELLGLVIPQGQEFKIEGESRDGAVIAVRGLVATWGSINTPTNFACPLVRLTFRIYDDCLCGVVDLKFCRNFAFRDLYVTDNDEHTTLGFFANLDRSYQCSFEDVLGRWNGGAMFELGDSSASEVIDTISLNNTVWHGNYGFFTRPGPLAINNILLQNAKFRDQQSSDEHTNANQGETYLTSSPAAAAVSFDVNDATQLKQGNLGAGDFVYMGVGDTAEAVRVASVVSNTINLDPNTPLRFSHTADLDSTGVGEPVIFGPVHCTTGFLYSLVLPVAHFERAWIAVHAYSSRGVSIGNVFSTCKNTFRLVNKSRTWDVGVVTMGNVGWGTVNLFDVPAYHDSAASAIFDVSLRKQVQADAGVTVNYLNNNSAQDTLSLLAFQVPGTLTVGRSLTTTVDPTRTSHAVIAMNGRIDNMNISAGIVPGQPLKITFIQDASGHRVVGQIGWSSNTSFQRTFVASSRANSRDEISFRWDGTNWVELGRNIEDLSGLPREVPAANIAAIGDSINTSNKYLRKPVLDSTNNQWLYASGSTAGSAWLDGDGATVITPA
jgi:hypothetical protein